MFAMRSPLDPLAKSTAAHAHTRRLQIGTVTFMFTDIEGSTALHQALGARYRRLLERHHRILRAAIAGGHGVEISTQGKVPAGGRGDARGARRAGGCAPTLGCGTSDLCRDRNARAAS